MPHLKDYKDFLRVYIEMHSSLDYSVPQKRNGEKYKSLRLRIYVNYVLMESFNKILHENANVGEKAIQILNNKKTAIIYYRRYKK